MNYDLQSLRLSVALGVFDGQCVGGGFGGGDFDTARKGRPDRIGLRLELYRLRVGNTITQPGCFSAVDDAGAGVEHLNRELFAAEQFDGCAIVLQLFLCPFLFSSLFDHAAFLPARKEDPADVEQRDSDGNRGIEQRVSEGGLGFGMG